MADAEGRLSYGMQSAQLKDIRKADPGGHGRHSFTAQQQTLRRLETSSTRSTGAARRQAAARSRAIRGSTVPAVQPGHVRQRRRREMGSRIWPVGMGHIPGGRPVKVRQHRSVPGLVKALQLKQEHRRWYVIVMTETEPVPLPAAGREVGVDVGMARFLTTSDGEVVANPGFFAASAELIADLERRKERAMPGSGNRDRLRRALAKQWRKVRNRSRDFHHKTARTLVRLRRDRAGRAEHRRNDQASRAEA